MTATDDGPPSASAALISVGRGLRWRRTIRRLELTAPGAPAAWSRRSLVHGLEAKRPLSHSQPQLTGSLSTPW
jgi:hypothetical protein